MQLRLPIKIKNAINSMNKNIRLQKIVMENHHTSILFSKLKLHINEV